MQGIRYTAIITVLMTWFYITIAILLMFYICRNVGSVTLRYRRPACGSVTDLALRCIAHISLSLNVVVINKRISFGHF